MAVLVEACSVLMRRDAIDTRITGGWEWFCDDVPNRTLCLDFDLLATCFQQASAGRTELATSL